MQPSSPQLSHCVSTECAVHPWTAYDFLCDGITVGHWALGALNARRVGRNLYKGMSLFDGEEIFFRPLGDRGRLLVDYWVGPDAGSLSLRAMTRVIPRARNSCVVSLTAWREASMTDDRWDRLVACHEVEIRLIQSLLSRI